MFPPCSVGAPRHDHCPSTHEDCEGERGEAGEKDSDMARPLASIATWPPIAGDDRGHQLWLCWLGKNNSQRRQRPSRAPVSLLSSAPCCVLESSRWSINIRPEICGGRPVTVRLRR